MHGRIRIPDDATGTIRITARLHYRKFKTELMRHVTGDRNYVNDLPVMLMAEDTIELPVATAAQSVAGPASTIPEWQRWNDYGIAMLRSGLLRQATIAFERVEALGRPDGPLNLARVYLQEGLVQSDAPAALQRAAAFDPPANEWSVLWFGAQVALRNGDLDEAIARIDDLLRGGFRQAQGRGFDFSKDYRVQNALGNACYQRGLRERGEKRGEWLDRARSAFSQSLIYDPENLAAHYGLMQVYRNTGDEERAEIHRAAHAKYKPDDNATDVAIAEARRRYPAANRAAEAVVIYDLQRPGAFGLPDDEARTEEHD